MQTTESTTETKHNTGVDRFGAFASTACALHCAACALVPASLTALGLDFLIGHEVEWALAGLAILFALVALFMGVKSHGNSLIIAILALGIAGLLTARIMEGQGHHGHHDEHNKHAADPHADNTKTTQAKVKDEHKDEHKD